MRVLLLVATCALGCGRIGYDARKEGPDASLVPIDGRAIDAPPACLAGMLEIGPGATVCIEVNQRGNLPWDQAKADCEVLGRRLCADAEWFAACTNQPSLATMYGDGYEWVAEESGGIAQKRGSSTCEDASSHAVIDPYDYRCCAAKQ